MPRKTWTRSNSANLDPRTVDWLTRASDEALRRQGRFRELVLRMLAPVEEITPEANDVWETHVVRIKRRHTEPSKDDLLAAWRESPDPLPAPIIDYIVRHWSKGVPRKRGPNTPPARSTWHDVRVIAFYQHQLGKAKARLVAKPAERAKARTARKFGHSVRTIESIISPRRWLTDRSQ